MTEASLPDLGDAAADFAALTGEAAVRRQIAIGLGVVGALAAFLIAGATVARLDSAVMSYGVVEAEGDRQVVEDPDGGVISAILVKEGDLVRQGQVLVRLDPTQANAALAIEQTSVDTLTATLARLQAEAAGAARVAYPKDLTARAKEPEVAAAMAGQDALFAARDQALSGQAGAIGEEIGQADSLAAGYRGQLASVQKQAAMIDDELAAVKSLYARGFATKAQVLALDRTAAGLEGQRREYEADLARMSHSVGQYQVQSSQLHRDRMSAVAEQIDDVRSKLADATQRRDAAKAVADHANIRAPVTGYVFGLASNTIGGVVGRGEKILEILPSDASPMVEARLRPAEGAHVRKGMKVEVRLTSAQGRGLPALHGVVQNRSVDLMSDPKTGAPYYRLTVAVDRDEASRSGGPGLDAGTPVEVVVPTGSRTALAYMVQPIMESFRHGLKEQ